MAPPRTDDDWSDSDSDDGLSQVETSVLLGVPDGTVEAEADRIDAAVSRIGGLPVRASPVVVVPCAQALLPSREPPIESSHCKSCAQPMELLVQMWCPFEDSPMDRALYIWGCARAGCQRKDGSVRAFRGIRTNEAYAQKLAQKRARQEQRERGRAQAEEERARHDKQRKEMLGGGNPFAMGAKAGSTMPAFGAGFGIGAQIFGGAPEAAPAPASTSSQKADNYDPEPEPDSEEVGEVSGEDNDDDEEDEEQLLTALAATSISDSTWNAAPAYPPLYLSTMSEYVPPEPKPKVPRDALVDALLDDDDNGKSKHGKSGKGGAEMEGWAQEAYENSMDVDQVFERFMKRVGYEGEQCVRYELNGTPLPFASDATFDLLWPAPRAEPLPVTKPAFKVVHPQRRVYDGPARVAKCERCGGPRVFECQLMPNLINVLLRAAADKDAKKHGKMTDEARRAAVARALKGQDEDARGMEWGTCMVFSCERDCCVEDGKEAKEAWREEVVLVQWDT